MEQIRELRRHMALNIYYKHTSATRRVNEKLWHNSLDVSVQSQVRLLSSIENNL